MHIAVKVRRVLARHSWIYAVVCGALALGTAVSVGRYVTALDQAKHDLGATRPVFVASDDHLPGEPVRTTRVDMPIALIPPSALGSIEADTVVRQRVSAGEVLVEADLAGPPGPAALADPGTVVVGLVDPMARNVSVGLEVKVVAEGIVLTEQARVVDLADDVIFVATEPRLAPTIAAAAHDGTAGILFLP